MAENRAFKAGILASGQFLTTCIRLITIVILARLLTVHDYATFVQTLLAYTFVEPLLKLGLPQALYYFLPGEKNKPRTILTENILLLGIMGGIFTAFLLFGGNRLLAWHFNNPDLAKTLLILSPYPLFMLPVSAISACLIARDRVKHVAIYNVVSRLVKLGIVITISMIWRTPTAAITGTLIGAVIIFGPALKLMFASCNVGSFLPTYRGAWTQVNYAIPLGLATIIGAVYRNLDKVVVSSLCTPEQFAIYVNGAIEIPLIGIITGSVISVLIPDFVKMYKASRCDEIRELWHRAMSKCLAILTPVMGFILVMAPEIMRVLFSAKYEGSAYPFRVYSLMLPIRATTYTAVLMSINHTKTITCVAVPALLLNGILSIFFVKLIGPIGAAWATVLATLTVSVTFSLFIAKYLSFSYKNIMPWKNILKTFIAAAMPTLVIYLFVPVLPENDILRLTITGVAFCLLIALSYKAFKIIKFSEIIASVFKRSTVA
ncbi:MAG: lipopolysaccharide biosynthesis protein [Planctomycetota bacterium]|jgi:O-antigen/teichoic acid export membrane protein